MPVERANLLCRYRYDPLDRLVDCTPTTQAKSQRFYLKDRLATEIQGSAQRSIYQQANQPLAQLQRRNGTVEITPFTTDLQRSIMHALDATGSHPLVYTPYGHRVAENGLLSLLGFTGERPDPVTGHYLLGNGYRAFNPVLMRFNSPDSWSPFGEGGLNAYAYCFGDPVNQQDPTGHISWANLMLKHFRNAMNAAEKMTTVSKQNPIINTLNIGSFHTFLGTPHIIDKIVRELPGEDLVSLLLTSKDMSRIVKSNIQPLTIRAPINKLSKFEIYELRSVALGTSKRQLPAQILKYENLKNFAKYSPLSDTPAEELFKTLTFHEHLKARLLNSQNKRIFTPKNIRQQS